LLSRRLSARKQSRAHDVFNICDMQMRIEVRITRIRRQAASHDRQKYENEGFDTSKRHRRHATTAANGARKICEELKSKSSATTSRGRVKRTVSRVRDMMSRFLNSSHDFCKERSKWVDQEHGRTNQCMKQTTVNEILTLCKKILSGNFNNEDVLSDDIKFLKNDGQTSLGKIDRIN